MEERLEIRARDSFNRDREKRLSSPAGRFPHDQLGFDRNLTWIVLIALDPIE